MTPPGASSVPASIEPSITVSAPAAIAFATSPEDGDAAVGDHGHAVVRRDLRDSRRSR